MGNKQLFLGVGALIVVGGAVYFFKHHFNNRPDATRQDTPETPITASTTINPDGTVTVNHDDGQTEQVTIHPIQLGGTPAQQAAAVAGGRPGAYMSSLAPPKTLIVKSRIVGRPILATIKNKK